MPRALIFSDIHNDARALEKLMDTEADYYFAAGDLVSWARGLDRMGEIMKRREGRVYVMPGNHESEKDIEAFCARHGFVNFHGGELNVTGVHIAGLGYSNPTPFDTPGEYSEEELGARLEKFADLKLADMKKMVLICHAPPLDTALDRVREGLHAGSRAVRQFIEKYQPAYFFCGHIHEAEGAAIQMGATSARNVGKRGYLLEL
jgi:Icc-related predicted phosphoesterase